MIGYQIICQIRQLVNENDPNEPYSITEMDYGPIYTNKDVAYDKCERYNLDALIYNWKVVSRRYYVKFIADIFGTNKQVWIS